jgi:hypothetical protein
MNVLIGYLEVSLTVSHETATIECHSADLTYPLPERIKVTRINSS